MQCAEFSGKTLADVDIRRLFGTNLSDTTIHIPVFNGADFSKDSECASGDVDSRRPLHVEPG